MLDLSRARFFLNRPHTIPRTRPALPEGANRRLASRSIKGETHEEIRTLRRCRRGSFLRAGRPRHGAARYLRFRQMRRNLSERQLPEPGTGKSLPATAISAGRYTATARRGTAMTTGTTTAGKIAGTTTAGTVAMTVASGPAKSRPASRGLRSAPRALWRPRRSTAIPIPITTTTATATTPPIAAGPTRTMPRSKAIGSSTGLSVSPARGSRVTTAAGISASRPYPLREAKKAAARPPFHACRGPDALFGGSGPFWASLVFDRPPDQRNRKTSISTVPDPPEFAGLAQR